jgi:Domain of unknown function (DUF4286)
MYIYNVTTSVDKAIETEWIQWMKSEHIPRVLNTGMFIGHQFYKVLSHDDQATSSYCVMYTFPVLDNFVKYLNEFAPALRAEVDQRYQGKYAAFRTLLEEVN